MLHRVGRRLSPGGVRHPGPPCRRPSRDHPRGAAPRAARSLGLRIRRPRGEPVRLLHARHRDAPRRPRGVRGRPAGRTVGTSRRRWRHLCRCTGWQSIVEAACRALGADDPLPTTDEVVAADAFGSASPPLALWRAEIEGPALQSSGPDVVLGNAGFADDTAPPGALVQLGADVPLAQSVRAARAGPGSHPGSKQHGAALPPGPVASRRVGADAADHLGRTRLCRARRQLVSARPEPRLTARQRRGLRGKRHSPVPARGRELADQMGEAVRVLWQREDVVRRGPKRPPLAIGLRPDGTGTVRLGRTAGSADLGPLVANCARRRSASRSRRPRFLACPWRPSCAAPGGPRHWPPSTH